MKRLVVFCALLISASVFAQPRASYINLNLDYGSLLTPDSDYSPNSFYNKTSHQLGGLGFGANVGYLFDSYQFSLPYEWQLGVEAGYNQFANNTYNYGYNFSSSTTNTITYSSYALSFLGVMRYQNDNGLLGFFKTGVARVVQSLATPPNMTNNTPSKANFAPQLTLGGGYQLSRSINFNASYNYIVGKMPAVGSNSSVAPVSYLAFTLGYIF
jgi:hypothetical protein